MHVTRDGVLATALHEQAAAQLRRAIAEGRAAHTAALLAQARRHGYQRGDLIRLIHDLPEP